MTIFMPEGFKFINGKIEYTVITFKNSVHENLALLKRDTYCPYVVARRISQNADGTYTWAWGHYLNDLSHATADFNERLLTLL